jgi:GT2 family glycosyltransferase
MSRPEVSAILPCYNHAEFLEVRIKSLLSQTIAVSEIIFLDDASTDSSIEIATKLLEKAHCQVHFILNHRNSGSSFIQWNKGVMHAIYPLIWIAETDDCCSLDLLQRNLDNHIQSDLIFSYSQSRYIDRSGVRIGSAYDYISHACPGIFEDSFRMAGSEFNTLCMTSINAVPNASAVLFRRDAFLEAGQANTSMRFAGDWDLWMRMAKLGQIGFIADELNFFRFHDKTTREQGLRPEIEAEITACRITAQLILNHPSKNEHQPSSLDSLCIKHAAAVAFAVKKATGSFPFGSLPWPEFALARRHYQRLRGIAQPSSYAWFMLSALCIYTRIKHKSSVWLQRLIYAARQAFIQNQTGF